MHNAVARSVQNVAMYVLPGLLKKPIDNERRQKVLKKPAA